MVNHFENHHEITTKDLLFENLLIFSKQQKIKLLEFVPLTFIINTDSIEYDKEFEYFFQCYSCVESFKERKNNSKQAKAVEGEDQELFYTCETNKINERLQFLSLRKEGRKELHGGSNKCILADTHYRGKNLWILKPTRMNRGRGVHPFEYIEQLKKMLKEYRQGVNMDPNPNPPLNNPTAMSSTVPMVSTVSISTGGTGGTTSSEYSNSSNCWAINRTSLFGKINMPCILKTSHFIVQKYIESPFLIYSRKFDIRVWALVTHELKLYFFQEGYLRTSSEAYSMESSDLYVHLTNNAVQKNSQTYGVHEDGNQLSFKQFQVYYIYIHIYIYMCVYVYIY